MSRDDLRFGDASGGGGGDPTDMMESVIQLAIQSLVLLVILYALVAILDVLIFNGAIPIV